jgi:hypothetical protein
MISDKNLRLFANSSDTTVAQDVFSASTTVNATFTVDLRSGTNVSGGTSTTQNRDIGEGQDLYLAITVATAFVGVGASMTFNVFTATDTGTTGRVVIGTSGAIPIANLTAGTQLYVRINPVLGLGQRYLTADAVTSGANTTAGAIFGDIVTDIADSKKFYGSGFVVA